MKIHFDNKLQEVVYDINRVFGKIEEIISYITLWALIAVCVVFISCRFIFHISTPWADESARYLLILLGWMGAAFAASNNDHLTIDILDSVITKRAKNPQKILDAIDKLAQLLDLVFLFGFLYFYSIYLKKMIHAGVMDNILPMPSWVPMSLLVIGIVLMIIHSACYLILPKRLWGTDAAVKARLAAEAEKEGEN